MKQLLFLPCIKCCFGFCSPSSFPFPFENKYVSDSLFIPLPIERPNSNGGWQEAMLGESKIHSSDISNNTILSLSVKEGQDSC